MSSLKGFLASVEDDGELEMTVEVVADYPALVIAPEPDNLPKLEYRIRPVELYYRHGWPGNWTDTRVYSKFQKKQIFRAGMDGKERVLEHDETLSLEGEIHYWRVPEGDEPGEVEVVIVPSDGELGQ